MKSVRPQLRLNMHNNVTNCQFEGKKKKLKIGAEDALESQIITKELFKGLNFVLNDFICRLIIEQKVFFLPMKLNEDIRKTLGSSFC